MHLGVAVDGAGNGIEVTSMKMEVDQRGWAK